MELIRDDIDFEAYMVEPDVRQAVRPAPDFEIDLIQRMRHGNHATGVRMPWEKTDEMFRLRPHEITLWPGINGHGKSLLLGQVMLSAMAQGEKVLVASMEMKPASTLERMARQACRKAAPDGGEVRRFLNWTDGKLWIYDHQGSVKWERFMGVLRYACSELGVTQIVIDSLMRCGIADDDYGGQKAFMDALCTLKMDYRVHVHLVLHSRKLADERQLPGKFDVKGTGTLTDLADNVVTVWRNKRKEEAEQKPAHQRTEGERQAIDGPDALMIVDKQRHWEWEGKISLWYLNGCMQYVADDTGLMIDLMGSH